MGLAADRQGLPAALKARLVVLGNNRYSSPSAFFCLLSVISLFRRTLRTEVGCCIKESHRRRFRTFGNHPFSRVRTKPSFPFGSDVGLERPRPHFIFSFWMVDGKRVYLALYNPHLYRPSLCGHGTGAPSQTHPSFATLA